MCAETHPSPLWWIEHGLLVIGMACLTWCAAVWLQAAVYQREQRKVLERVLAPASLAVTAPGRVAPGGLIGSLDIPRLHLSAVIAEGDDDSTLGIAIGHLPDTPLPWEDGNSALAAHRDTFFRPLKDIRVGDPLRLTTVHGDLFYQVRETMVVDPEDVWVLESTGSASLTLITCYPFGYVGHAPQRFIVRGERIGPIKPFSSNRLPFGGEPATHA